MGKFKVIIMCNVVMFVAILVHFMGINAVEARKHVPVLIEDDGIRKNNRSAECLFGKELKELGSTWFADLGPPFGIMYCLRCECVALQKKRRIVARVQCKNIKNECPKPNCDDPVLLPGRCCKTCAGDNTSIVQDVPQPSITEDEERNIKQFASLLTPRTSQILKREDFTSMYSINNPQNIVATGRFMLHKKNLYYSFYISEKASRPRSIQFLDHNGNILEEHNLTVPLNVPFSIYQNSTGKVCGVWRRLPRDYKKLLKEDQIVVVLLWGGKFQAELALAGRVEKFASLQTEILSSLLEPAPGTSAEQMAGAGGTAIVSTVSGDTSSIHLTLLVNGVFSPDEIADAQLNIRLEALDKKQLILEEVQKVKKPAHAVNVIEISSPVFLNDLRMLTRGKIFITVESRKNPALRLQGQIVTRVTCEIFQTVLASHNPDSITRTNGLAWLYLNKEGSLNYNIELNEITQDSNPIITLVDDSIGKRRMELEDLTTSLNRYSNEAFGSIDKLKLRVLEPLYAGSLIVNVASKSDVVARGRLITRPVADARDSQSPILFKKADKYSAPNVAGMAWLAVDTECNVHYEITMTGLHQQKHLELYLETIPFEVPGAPVNRKLLEEFSGNYLEGFRLDINSNDLANLETHVCYLEVYSREHKRALLRAKLKNVKVPNNCFQGDSDNELPSLTYTKLNDPGTNNIHTYDSKCYHSGRFYNDGDQWASSFVPCQMCSCYNRRVKCEPIKCPPLNCRPEDIRQVKGECCPICTKNSNDFGKTDRGCKLNDHFYPVGYSWHPYLPPNGYETCTVCTCDDTSLKVNCKRTECPPLTCDEKDAYRPDKKSCCRKCPEIRPSVVNHDRTTEYMKDQGIKTNSSQTNQMILANGGCKIDSTIYNNGHEWHPMIASLGEQKCIKCNCKDGKINCDRKRCTRSACHNRAFHKRRDDGEQDDCCSAHCRRARRHNRNSNHQRKSERAREREQQQQQRS